jgi:hypothetical protein
MALWTPANDGSRVWGWWRVKDFATLTLDGSNLATNLADKSGNGRHLSATAPTYLAPLYSATAFNGQPGLTFSLDEILRRSGLSVPAGTIINVFMSLYGMTGMFTNARIVSFAQGGNDYDSPSVMPLAKIGDASILSAYYGGAAQYANAGITYTSAACVVACHGHGHNSHDVARRNRCSRFELLIHLAEWFLANRHRPGQLGKRVCLGAPGRRLWRDGLRHRSDDAG